MSGIPSIDDAFKKLESMTGLEERFQAGVSKQAAILAAAVQLEKATTMDAASAQLSKSIDAFTLRPSTD